MNIQQSIEKTAESAASDENWQMTLRSVCWKSNSICNSIQSIFKIAIPTISRFQPSQCKNQLPAVWTAPCNGKYNLQWASYAWLQWGGLFCKELQFFWPQLGCAVLSLLSCITVASSNFDGLFSGALLRSPNPYNRIQKNVFWTYDPFSLISHISDRVL